MELSFREMMKMVVGQILRQGRKDLGHLILLDFSLLEIQRKVKSRRAVGYMSMEFRGEVWTGDCSHLDSI